MKHIDTITLADKHEKNRQVYKAVVALLLISTTVIAADWPHFGGASRNQTSPETGLMKNWPEGGPKELWSIPVGKGYGGVAIKDDELYMLDRETGKADVLRCLDPATGKEKWSFKYNAVGRYSYPGSRTTPSVDDKYVFILSPFGELRCMDRKTHKPVWTHNILKEFDGGKRKWALAHSPALYKNRVVVNPVGAKAGMVAYDKDTGSVVWKSKPFIGEAGYSSPMLATIDGVDQLLTATSDSIVGVDANSGKTLWTNSDWSCKWACASPVYLKDNLVFMSGGYGAGSILVEVKKGGSGFSATTRATIDECNGQIHQPVRIGDYIYLNGNDKAKRNGFMCLDLNGKVMWKTGRKPGFDWGGMLYADGMIYTVDGTKGDLVMIQPDPKKYIEVGRANFLSGPQQWGTIALSDGRLLLRDQKQLKCVDVRGK